MTRQMLLGEYTHTMDDKGRIIIPARLRDALGDTVVLARGADGQINVYPLETWQQIAAKVAQQNQGRRVARDVSRMTFAVSPCELDKEGRIGISQPLRQHAALATDIVSVGVNDHVEIWSQERWQEVTARLQTDGGDMTEQMVDLGLVL